MLSYGLRSPPFILMATQILLFTMCAVLTAWTIAEEAAITAAAVIIAAAVITAVRQMDSNSNSRRDETGQMSEQRKTCTLIARKRK